MYNRYIQSIYGAHLVMAERYNGWASLGKTPTRYRSVHNELEATAIALAINMDLDGVPKDGKVPLKVNKPGILKAVTKKLGRTIEIVVLDSRVMEVRDDIQALEQRFAGYLYHR